MSQTLTIDDVIDTTVAVFNQNYQNSDLRGLLTREKLLQGHKVLASRPFSQYRDVCALFAQKYAAANDAILSVSLLPNPNPVFQVSRAPEAAKRARRNLQQGNSAYAFPYDKLVNALLPPELQAGARAHRFLQTHNVKDEPIDLRVRRKLPAPLAGKPDDDAEATEQKPDKLPVTADNIRRSCIEAWNKVVKMHPHNRSLAVTLDLLDTREKSPGMVKPRRISMYACHRLLDDEQGSFANVGKLHGGRFSIGAHEAFNIVSVMVSKGADAEMCKVLELMAGRLDLSATAAFALLNPGVNYQAEKSPAESVKMPVGSDGIKTATMWAWNKAFAHKSISTLDMESKGARRDISLPRQIAMYAEHVLMGSIKGHTAEAIAAAYRRDRSTAIYGIQEIARKVQAGDAVVIDILNRMIAHLDCSKIAANSLLNPQIKNETEAAALAQKPTETGEQAEPAVSEEKKERPEPEQASDGEKFAPYVKRPLTIENIKRATINAWNGELHASNSRLFDRDHSLMVTIDHINSKRRDKFMMRPRQISMYVCATLLEEWMTGSLSSIGKKHGGRDYATVLHAYKKIAELLIAGDQKVTRVVHNMLEHLNCTPVMADRLLNPMPERGTKRRPMSESPKAP